MLSKLDLLKKIGLALLVATFLNACNQHQTQRLQLPQVDQEQLKLMAESLAVVYKVVDNRSGDHCPKDKAQGFCFKGQISLTTERELSSVGWAIYFSHISPIRSADSDEFAIEHINGDLHRIGPTKQFQGFSANKSKKITFFADYWHLSETDPVPNYYLAAANLRPQIIKSTQTRTDPDTGLELRPFVEAFTNVAKQFKRGTDDKTSWASAAALYKANSNLTQLTQDLSSAIIPTPQRVTLDPKARKLSLLNGIHIAASEVERWAIDAALARLASFGIKESKQGVAIYLTKKPLPRIKNAVSDISAGSYVLDIKPTKINIEAKDAEGAANALNSLASLLTLGEASVPVLRVEDAPRYGFRGMHVDVARNFHSKQFILKLLDQMAAYKLNKLHLHLGDDEGWRMEIPGLPELHQIASKRCHDLEENRCLLPQLGSGPYGDTAVNGYYSVVDYQEILRAASARHIQVIPSFDMPGHSRAAIKAMQARYRKLMARGEAAKAQQYLLSDANDRSLYSSVQHYNDNTINVCMNSSYAFVEKVIDEMLHIHEQAGHPLSRYHIGADETAGAWKNSPACKTFLKNNTEGLTKTEQLGAYFIERVANLLASKGIETAAWSDGLSHTRTENMPAKVQSNAWTPLFWGGHQGAQQQANRGWDVIVSLPEATYFDFPYEADPKERGFYWGARSVNSRKVFELMPDNLPVHAEFWQDRNGAAMHINDSPQKNEHGELSGPLAENRRFAGLQGHLWSEVVRSDTQAEYMIFPRLLALSERAWHRASWEVPYNYQGAQYHPSSNTFTATMRAQREQDWQHFANTLGQKELIKLDRAGIFYRLPTVGGRIDDGKLRANTHFPGLAIEYRVDGGDWTEYRSAVSIQGAVELRVTSPDGQRKGRILPLE